MNAPLPATAARATTVATAPTLQIASSDPIGAGWTRWTNIAAGDLVERWIDAGSPDDARGRPMRQIGGMSTLGRLAAALMAATVLPYALDGRVPDLGGDDLWVHETPQHAIDRIVVTRSRFHGLASDPHRGHPDAVVVPGPGQLRDRLAELLAAATRPVVAAVRAHSRIGGRSLWGVVSNSAVAWRMLPTIRATADLAAQQAAWADAQLLLDALSVLEPGLSARPVAVTLHGRERSILAQVRPGCCFVYKHPDRIGPDGTRVYCTSCPLLEDTERLGRYAHHLDAANHRR